MTTHRSLLVASAGLLSMIASAASAATVRVGAAISMKESLEAVAAKYESATGDTVECSFGSSGQIQSQIRAGAPLDVFISAANKQVDELQKDNLVDALSRRVVVINRVVMIVPADAKDAPASLWKLADSAVKRIAIGEPNTVPAGDYATQALASMQLTDAVKDKLVYGTNVRQVLSYVERGEVDAGMVYATDAKEAGDKVRVVDTVDFNRHQPIVYPAVVITAAADRAAAQKFLDFLSGGDAQAIFKQAGFVTAESAKPTEPATPPATQPATPAAGR